MRGRLTRLPAVSKREVLKAAKFAAVGTLNTIVDYAVWAAFFYLVKAPLLVCQTAGYGAGVANSYVLNSLWTFGEKQLWSRERILKFLVVNAISYAASLGFIVAFTSFLPPWLGKICAMGATLSVNFLGSRLWVFRRRKNVPTLPRGK